MPTSSYEAKKLKQKVVSTLGNSRRRDMTCHNPKTKDHERDAGDAALLARAPPHISAVAAAAPEASTIALLTRAPGAKAARA